MQTLTKNAPVVRYGTAQSRTHLPEEINQVEIPTVGSGDGEGKGSTHDENHRLASAPVLAYQLKIVPQMELFNNPEPHHVKRCKDPTTTSLLLVRCLALLLEREDEKAKDNVVGMHLRMHQTHSVVDDLLAEPMQNLQNTTRNRT